MNRRLLSRVLASVFLAVAVSVPLAAADRVALVIGNGDYENVAKLENPGNDASAFASVLRAGGYEVIEVIDGGVGDMALALKRFARLGESAEKAVFYYAPATGSRWRGRTTSPRWTRPSRSTRIFRARTPTWRWSSPWSGRASPSTSSCASFATPWAG